ncbi:MAG: glycosyltransferase family 4 protein [Rhodothermaceae bacterium]|nr:glycosyltransferase family 4 protein [Rhodothermaceae bacterium]
MLDIVHLTSVHIPTDTRIFQKELKTLRSSGYHVTLIAPGSEDQVLDGITVRHIPVYRNRLKRFVMGPWNIYRLARKMNADIYHFHDPELVTAGLALKMGGRRVIYDVHEDMPRQLYDKDYLPSWIIKPLSYILEKFELFAASRFDGIVTVTPTINRRFPADKAVMVQNFPILNHYLEIKTDNYLRRPNMVIFMGMIQDIRGISEVTEAMVKISGDFPGAEFRLIGKIVPDSYKHSLSQSEGWKYVNSFGWLSQQEVNTHLEQARIGVVTYHPYPNHIEAQPNKLFEYMAAGLPVIASDFPLWRNVVDTYKCGLLVDPESVSDVVKAVSFLLANPAEAEAMGKRGRQAVIDHFNWDSEAEHLKNLYKKVLAQE